MASVLTRPLDLAAFHRIFLLTLLIGLFCVVEINSGKDSGNVVGEGGRRSQREFDYFLLSYLWPATSCRSTRHCCSTNACCHGRQMSHSSIMGCLNLDKEKRIECQHKSCFSSNNLTEFTIHGLWSDYNDGTWPACCTGKRFDLKEISTLLGALNKYWPSYSCSSISNCHGGKGLFWEHEWEKHGTCSASVTGDEYSYFLTTLNLYFKYNVTEILKNAGYVVSNSEKYPLGGIISAIQNAFHATPELVCSGDVVDELRLCFYKDFKPRDCSIGSKITSSGPVNSSTSCPKYVSLPEYVSSNLAYSGTEALQSTLISTI